MDNGGSPVTSYTVRYEDQGGNVLSVDGITPGDMWAPQELLVSGTLAEGELYTFYVQAVNAYGTSGASPALTVVAAIPAGIVSYQVRETRLRPVRRSTIDYMNQATCNVSAMPA